MRHTNLKGIKIKSKQFIRTRSFISKGLMLVIFCFLMILLSIPSSFALHWQYGNPPSQNPNVNIELDTYDQEIDTSPSIAEPIVQVEGQVTLMSQHPYVTVNLTIDKTSGDWNCSVIPNKFNLSNYPVDQSIQDITVTIRAPQGMENGTTQRFILHGTWSYIPEIPGVPSPNPLHGEIEPVFLDITAKNETSGQGDDNNTDGKKKSDKDDSGFLPGFEGILVITSISLIVLFYFQKRAKKR